MTGLMPARERVADRLARHHDHDRRETNSDELTTARKRSPPCEFAVTLATETAGGFLVRASGTSLRAIESEGCRTVVERIASEHGWAVDGSQVERLRARGNEYARLFLFQERTTEREWEQEGSEPPRVTVE
jgi:hypothetical protein